MENYNVPLRICNIADINAGVGLISQFCKNTLFCCSQNSVHGSVKHHRGRDIIMIRKQLNCAVIKL